MATRRPASRARSRTSAARPWTNSAPSSTGTGQPRIRRVQIRPPARARASRTSTDAPARVSASAAASPAAPAPTTMTSGMRFMKRGGSGGGTLQPCRDLLRRDRPVALQDPGLQDGAGRRVLLAELRGDPAGLSEAVAGRRGEGELQRLLGRSRQLHAESHLAAGHGIETQEDADLSVDLRDALAPGKVLRRSGQRK